MHKVVRLGYRMSTDSIMAPSNKRHSVLIVVPSSALWCVTSWMSSGKKASCAVALSFDGKSVNDSTSVSKCAK